MKTCSVEGCDKKHDSHGYCGMHGMRWRKYGNPLYTNKGFVGAEAQLIRDRGCAVEGCDKPHDSHGYCGMHNMRLIKNGEVGSVEPIRLIGVTQVERFWFHVDKTEDCWVWTGSLSEKGYGQFMTDFGVPRRANRISWELTYGEIPDGLSVLHHCDNPPCVRPDHLFLGTAKVNTDDMVSKGRDRFFGHDPKILNN